VRSDDLTLALIEMRQAAARERGPDTPARQTRREARRAGRREDRGSTSRRWWWLGLARPGVAGMRVWIRTSWHGLPGQRAGDRPRR
jgi:hypothetical protein